MIGLEQLVGMSTVIVVARPAPDDPLEKVFDRNIGSEPYRYVDKQYRIISVLRGEPGIIDKADITVTSFNADALRSHFDYYVRGLSRGCSVACYKADPPLELHQSDERILFLRRTVFLLNDLEGRINIHVNDLAAPCWGAGESPAKEKVVTALIKKHPPASDIDFTVGVCSPVPREHHMIYMERMKELFPGLKSFSMKVINLYSDHR